MKAFILICFALYIFGGASAIAAETHLDTVWVRGALEAFGRHGYFDGLAIGNNSTVMLAAYGSVGGTYSIFEIDMANGLAVDSMPTPFTDARTMVMASKAGVFAVGGLDNIIRIYRWPEKTLIREIKDSSVQYHKDQYPHMAMTSDGRKLYNSTTNTLYDIETGDVIWRLPQRGWGAATPIITPDDQYLLSDVGNSGGNAALLMEVATGRWMATFPGGTGGSIDVVGMSDDARYIGVHRPSFGSERSSLVVYDRGTETFVDTLLTEYEIASSIRFTPGNTGLLFDANTVDHLSGRDYTFMAMGSWAKRSFIRYGGPKHSVDWKYYYGKAGGKLWLSRANLDPVGVHEQTQGTVDVVPQPAGGSLELRNVQAADGPAVIQIMDMEGRLGSEQEVVLVNGRCLVLTEGLSSGVYLLRLSRQGQVLCSTSVVIR